MELENQWKLVLARDARSDGVFVYAVRSTGVYCRPSCASRRPRREQVEFFPLPAAAERAGFRPCLRCKPDRAKSQDPQVEMARRACAYLDAHPEETVKLTELAAYVGASPYHLQRTFTRVMGISPRAYQSARRMERFKKELKERGNVTHALYEAGFGSSSRLYERAPSKLGMTPATYRRGGPGVEIRYTVVTSPLGRLLVAATDRGVCRIGMGDSDPFLENDLRKEFPAAQIQRDDFALRAWSNTLVKHLNGWQPRVELPLDIRATAFQMRVWETLRRIPLGSTRSYAEVARSVAKPGAARAVARACATNPVAILIPCHRVVRGDGSLGGYHWGIKRKEALLANETSAVQRQKRKA